MNTKKDKVEEVQLEAVDTAPALTTPKKRITRRSLKPMGALEVNESDLDRGKFVYRWVNDKNVQRKGQLGYEIATIDGEQDRRHANFSKEAASTHTVLMRIPKEDYEEIQQYKKQVNDEQMESITPVDIDELGSKYGLKARIEK